MTSLAIKNAIIHLEQGKQVHGHVYIHRGKISSFKEITHLTSKIEPCTKIIDANFNHLIPGFIDTHIHGSHGADIMDANEQGLDRIATHLPYEGTTSFLATTMTQHTDQIEAALTQAGNYKNKVGQAELLSIHLEGPFIAKSKAGAQPTECIILPQIELFRRWQILANHRIKIITMAPELDPHGEFISKLVQQGCIISAGHTNSNFQDIKKAVNEGVSQITHLGNAMNSIHHREVGPIGAAFLLKNLKAELIADEIHVTPEMLEIVYQQMGSNRIILITDAIRAKGRQNGAYELGGQIVHVKNGKALLPSGELAGSTLSMQQAAKNMFKIRGVTFNDIINMTAKNPAKQLGIYDKKGSITIGKDADILLVDKQLNIKHIICKGWLIK